MNVRYDDQYTAIIDGSTYVNGCCFAGASTNSFTFQSSYNNYYNVIIHHSNSGRGATYLYFNWTYSPNTCDGEPVSGFSGRIPEEYYCRNPTVLLPSSSIPFDINVTCPDGLEANHTNLVCIEVPGNSYRTGSEQCDDGNNIENDGCTNATIDPFHVCRGGSPTSVDT